MTLPFDTISHHHRPISFVSPILPAKEAMEESTKQRTAASQRHKRSPMGPATISLLCRLRNLLNMPDEGKRHLPCWESECFFSCTISCSHSITLFTSSSPLTQSLTWDILPAHISSILTLLILVTRLHT